MLGRDDGSDARTREEIMYWKSLNPFFKIHLRPNFRYGIEIPLYFSENVKGKLPHKVALKGPSVNIDTWEVQLKTHDDTTWIVGEGLEEFVSAFGLEENDTLVFKYKNNSYFKVRIFNEKTSCEKESSHFVVKSVSQQSQQSCSLLKDTCSLKQETIGEVEKISNNDQSSISRGSREKRVLFEDSESDDDKPLFLRCIIRNKDAVKPKCPTPLAFCRAVKRKTEPEVEYNSYPRNSCSRDQKEMEIQRARQRAKELQMHRENSFFVALSRSHVYGTMKLGIPKQWWNEVVKSQFDKCLKLRVKGKDEYDPHLLAKPLEDNYEFIYLEVEIIRAINS
uniref:TF-B3 domain-containing protein n=1 Tax=Chenopodium quinoa TaxID=63459 RepID=A0A803L4T4_CHEQI